MQWVVGLRASLFVFDSVTKMTVVVVDVVVTVSQTLLALVLPCVVISGVAAGRSS